MQVGMIAHRSCGSRRRPPSAAKSASFIVARPARQSPDARGGSARAAASAIWQ
jgi:hypothetical protein